ncbi:FkbM family methyltransferase [Pedobacter fastidiosus]|uniref:FkbM family methyltransferase n=1 Tax=Pedobacter fastidiosus TaxID=2765361 RepID=A0ABR7KVQ3_9SPHI|nr:FkbM family methyltransferase [Pedobacter fastidiosus]MBC6112184.1 FkbM family methyltransferase [Pedobacter fastidiosus]
MFPEILSQSIINKLTEYFDPTKKGFAIEIGIGTDNFYCVEYKKSGLKCIAIDPIPHQPFVNIARELNINFEKVCIYDFEGEITFYSNELTDLSSINENWWGIDKKNKQNVQAILFQTLLDKYSIINITFLKVDTEGTEFEILKQLEGINPTRLPCIIEFEYGGGGLKKNGINGWSHEYFNKVIKILHILKRLGYEQGLILESNEIENLFFDVNKVTSFESLFKNHFEYGNLIIFKKKISKTEEVQEIISKIQTYELKKKYDQLIIENQNLHAKYIKTKYLRRLIHKAKNLFKKYD